MVRFQIAFNFDKPIVRLTFANSISVSLAGIATKIIQKELVKSIHQFLHDSVSNPHHLNFIILKFHCYS